MTVPLYDVGDRIRFVATGSVFQVDRIWISDGAPRYHFVSEDRSSSVDIDCNTVDLDESDLRVERAELAEGRTV